MGAYLPLILWLLGMVACHYIAKARGVKSTFLRRLFVVFFGPLAIPFVFLFKPEHEAT